MKKHLYVILRLDTFQSVEVPIPERVTGTKAYLSEEDAAEECRRLQALNGGKGCVYFVVLARLIVDEATAGTTET